MLTGLGPSSGGKNLMTSMFYLCSAVISEKFFKSLKS